MKLSATSILVTFATLSGVLAQAPEPPSMDQPMNPAKGYRYYATKCENIRNLGEDWHLRCEFKENQKISEDEARASGAQLKVLVTKL